MSKQSTSNSDYGIESIPDANREISSLGSSVGLSVIQDETEPLTSGSEQNLSQSNKTESIRSLWSTNDISSDHGKHSRKNIVARTVTGTRRIQAGPRPDEPIDRNVTLVVTGDALVRGNLQVEQNIDAQTITAINVASQNVFANNFVASGSSFIQQSDRYIAGANGAAGSDFIILPSDDVNIVYANPINGTVNIYLGTGDDDAFPRNRTLVVKDVTPEFGSGSSFDVNIHVQGTGIGNARIEHYDNGLVATQEAAYTITTSGGAVTLCHARFPLINSIPAWVIESQFSGNPRLLGRAGVAFRVADDRIKGKIINLK